MRIFTRFRGIYENKALVVLKPEEEEARTATWIRVVNDFSDMQIMKALDFCEREREEIWPPSVVEFRSICRRFSNVCAKAKEKSEIEAKIRECEVNISAANRTMSYGLDEKGKEAWLKYKQSQEEILEILKVRLK